MKLFVSLIFLSLPVFAQSTLKYFTADVVLVETPIKINALLVIPKGNDKSSPLIVHSHGAGNPPPTRKFIDVDSQLVMKANRFLEMGFNVLIVERRGYGKSHEAYVEIPGDPEVCDTRDYTLMGRHMEADIILTLEYAMKNKIATPTDVILAGKSRGGFASIFASRFNSLYSSSLIKGVLNFSGGAGGKGPNNCNKPGMTEALKMAGTNNHVPTFWIYAENDSYFFPDYARSMFDDFLSAGGNGEFHMLAPLPIDGHNVFEWSNNEWMPLVEKFLKKIGVCPKCSQIE